MNYISTLFPHWEKHKIHFQTRRFLEFGWWEFFLKKETCHQNINHIIRTLNLSDFCLYLISLLGKTQNTFLHSLIRGLYCPPGIPCISFFGNNVDLPNPCMSECRNVFWVFPNKEMRYKQKFDRFRVLMMWLIFWWQVSFLRKNSKAPCLKMYFVFFSIRK